MTANAKPPQANNTVPNYSVTHQERKGVVGFFSTTFSVLFNARKVRAQYASAVAGLHASREEVKTACQRAEKTLEKHEENMQKSDELLEESAKLRFAGTSPTR